MFTPFAKACKTYQLIESNAKALGIPITIFESSIFDSVDQIEKSPCYICARMRRGYLYSRAKALECNKIALGHHYDDVIEMTSKRLETKKLIAELKKTNPFVEANIFKSVENVNLSTVIAYKKDGIRHDFLDEYQKENPVVGE